MSESGFIQVLHELLRSEAFISAPPNQCKVLITILDRACFCDCIQDDHGVPIHLKQGQLLTTLRQLGKDSGTNKKVVERAIARFSKSKIVTQEMGHKKTVLTVLWGIKYETCGTRNGTRMGQEWDIKEEDKKTRSSDEDDERANTRKEKSMTKGGYPLRVKKIDAEGNEFEAVLEEYFAYVIRKKLLWSTAEIEKAWEKFFDVSCRIGDWKRYMDKIIETEVNPKQEEKKCTTKKKSEKRKDFYSENDTKESPLAKFASQMSNKEKF